MELNLLFVFEFLWLIRVRNFFLGHMSGSCFPTQGHGSRRVGTLIQEKKEQCAKSMKNTALIGLSMVISVMCAAVLNGSLDLYSLCDTSIHLKH